MLYGRVHSVRVHSSEFSVLVEKVIMTIWPTGTFRCCLEHKTGSCVFEEEEKKKLSAMMTNM